jgi:L-fucose mutarotase
MLRNIDPILGPELLSTLRAMGHGDEIAIVDGNYPALEHARRLIRLDGMALLPVVSAILSVLPVDDFVDAALFRSAKGSDPQAIEPVHQELADCCRHHVPDQKLHVVVGKAFYDRVRQAHTVVATSEPRLYANLIIRKGVIRP